jgi:hypothetical protein
LLKLKAKLPTGFYQMPNQVALALKPAYSGKPAAAKADMQGDMQLVAQLHQRLAAAAAAAEAAGAVAAEQQAAAVAATAADAERQQHRHLAFIDRLLADKDALTHKCSALAGDIASADQR